MDNRNNRRRRRKPRVTGNTILRLLSLLFALIAILIVVQACNRILDKNEGKPSETPSNSQGGGIFRPTKTEPDETKETTPPPPTDPPVPTVVGTASIGVTGDILMHGPVINAGKSGTDYDFSSMFRYVKPYFEKYDYMVANLETTLGGKEAGEYKGYPNFNCPDAIVDGLKGAGVDMLLTANNHAYDTGYAGFKRTLEVLKNKGMDSLGTRLNVDDPQYKILNINGIKVGLICYTYETGGDNPDRNYLNGIMMSKEASPLVTCFNKSKLETFYSHVEGQLEEMEDAGAEVLVVFMHWGEEYELSARKDTQKALAQKLCDLGVDVIVGGHPHVIQPFETLTSASGEKTYCIYSVGNALSNQNRVTLETTTSNCKYTEDGMIFGMKFQKWSDGTVEVAEIEIIPTWIEKKTSGKVSYTIFPLDPTLATWSDMEATSQSRLVESYNRTMSLVGEGLNLCREYLDLETVVTTMTEK